jgi:HEAT repeat protein
VIDFQALLVTLGILLGIVALTTVAAIANKIVSIREDTSKRRSIDRLRQCFLLVKTGDPEMVREGLDGIARAATGHWSEAAAEEIAQLELGLRLDAIRALEEQGVVARYLRDARSPWKWTRARALRVLGELKIPTSVPTLLAALGDRDPDVRNVAARALGRMKLQAAEEALVSLLGKHDQAVSSRIAAICIEMGPRTAPLLIRALRDGAARARFWAAHILGEIRDPRATRSLCDALLDKDAEVRSAATRALGSLADRATAPIVLPLLRDPVWYVRARAAEALGRIGDEAAVEPLAEALRDRSWWVRKNALDALVRLGPASRSALTRTLGSDDRFARDSAAEALAALGAAPPPEGSPA